MERQDGDGQESLYRSIAERAYRDVLRGDYALLGAYLPEPVLLRVAELSGETDNGFDFSGGAARLRLHSTLLSSVLDDVRSKAAPSRRWCVLARNVVHLFEVCRGSLAGADLSGLDLRECDLSGAILEVGGLSANLDGSLVDFDSFISYRFPGLAGGEEPFLCLDVRRGQMLLGCCGSLLHVDPAAPERARVLCDLRPLLREEERICKVRLSLDGRCVLLTLTKMLDAWSEATDMMRLRGLPDHRVFLFDGRNLIPCHDERKVGEGAVLRTVGGTLHVWLERRELARFRERFCWEIASGDPRMDELSAADCRYSADLRYRLENDRITELGTHRALAHVYAAPGRAGAPIVRVNPTLTAGMLEYVHQDSKVSAAQLRLLRGGEVEP
jgi:uncharacterized protein YjbI with pentapeptide repeats